MTFKIFNNAAKMLVGQLFGSFICKSHKHHNKLLIAKIKQLTTENTVVNQNAYCYWVFTLKFRTSKINAQTAPKSDIRAFRHLVEVSQMSN